MKLLNWIGCISSYRAFLICFGSCACFVVCLVGFGVFLVFFCRGFLFSPFPQSCCCGGTGVQAGTWAVCRRRGGALWLQGLQPGSSISPAQGQSRSWWTRSQLKSCSTVSMGSPGCHRNRELWAEQGFCACSCSKSSREELQCSADLPCSVLPWQGCLPAALAWQQTWHEIIWLCAVLNMNMN